MNIECGYNAEAGEVKAGWCDCPMPYRQFRVRVPVLRLAPVCMLRVPHQLRVHPHPLRLLQPVIGIFLDIGALRIQNRLRHLSHRMAADNCGHANHQPLDDGILRHVPRLHLSYPSFAHPHYSLLAPHSGLLPPAHSSLLAPARSSLLASAYSKRGTIPESHTHSHNVHNTPHHHR